MTTDKHPIRLTTSRSVIVAALGVTVVVGIALVVLAVLTADAAAVRGAAVGIGMVALFFGLGGLALNAVAGAMPAASLLFAMLTYTLQVLLVALLFVGLRNSGLLDSTLDRQWIGGAVIVGTITWLLAQIVATTRVRQPVYDLPSGDEEAGAR